MSLYRASIVYKDLNPETTLYMMQVVSQESPDLMLTYQVTAGQRPVVAQRDFLFLTSVARADQTWVAGGCSVAHPSHPATANLVRAWQYPTCMTVTPSNLSTSTPSSNFTWLLQCDFGGLLPQAILNAAMPYAIGLFVGALRKETKKAQQKK